jgi:enamine deaminase RidA (YjgF/YER057c/UK114 family)
MTQRTPIRPQGAAPNPALSPGIRAGDFLFISGNVANDGSGNLVGEGNCEAQTRQVMANIRAIAAAGGAAMQDVVKITCFLTAVADYAAYGRVRSETFPNDPPASSTVIVAGLIRPEYLVEVEAVVYIPRG